MYAYITGKITKVNPKYIVLENNGIGYLLIVANPYLFKLNEEIKVYIYQHVKEDILDLYGFKTEEEKELFLKLISVSGIGPKSALSILASGTVEEITLAIENGNDAYLKKFPGIGTKASLQIILDLKGKLNSNNLVVNSNIKDTEDALVALGYNKKDLAKILNKLDPNKDVASLVKEALKMLIK